MSNKAQQARAEIQAMDTLAAMDSPMHGMSPLSKLLVILLYILVVVSFPKYEFTGLFIMILFPVFWYQFGGIPIHTCFHKLRVVMPLVCAVGLLNPFFDREILWHFPYFSVSGGVISMCTLAMKGIFSLMASFILVATTPVEELCRAFRQLRFPKILTSLFLLTFRYVSVLLDEVAVMTEAYHLRAPRQKGIHISAWGSFLGQLILRSMDRAEALYDSMLLRGFHGEFHYSTHQRSSGYSWLFFLICAALILLMRWVNIPQLIGSLFV